MVHITITWKICVGLDSDNSHAKDDIEIFFLIRPHSESFIVLSLLDGFLLVNLMHNTGCSWVAVIGITVRMVGVKASYRVFDIIHEGDAHAAGFLLPTCAHLSLL